MSAVMTTVMPPTVPMPMPMSTTVVAVAPILAMVGMAVRMGWWPVVMGGRRCLVVHRRRCVVHGARRRRIHRRRGKHDGITLIHAHADAGGINAH